MKPILFCFPDDEAFARHLSSHLDVELGQLHWHRFPDGESLMTLRTDCRDRDVLVLCSLSKPDIKSMPLYFCATTARELGARRVSLIAPYLAYMRQDHRFDPGQSISALSYAEFLSTIFDSLITIDPHLHRIHELESIFSIPAVTISSMPAVAEWIRANVANPVLIGPDMESAQWVEQVAGALDAPCVVLEKTRKGDRNVSVTDVPAAAVRGRSPVILDDIASSGHTMAEVLKRLAGIGVHDATCVVVHAVLAEGAEASLRAAGAKQVVSTNTVPHSTNQIDVAPLLAAGLKRLG